MRMPLAMNLCLAGALGLVLGACRQAPQEAPATAADATPPSAGDAGTAPPVDAAGNGASLEGELIASTNEPFWSAHVAGQVLQLSGIEAQRELAVATSVVEGGTRTVRATDATGEVELEVTATPCQDNMSGARFPYSAVLTIDGGAPINGCARPASMPPPGQGL